MSPGPSPNSPIVTRRRALALGGGALLGVAASGTALTLPAQARTTSTLADVFEATAAAYGVPRDLLVAIGYAETRLTRHDGPSQARGFGLMHLVDNPRHQTLAEAARLTDHSKRALRVDTTANIEGAAAVLRAYADDARFSAGTRRDLGAWYPVVARYSGAKDPYVARLYADGVYDVFWTGADAAGVRLEADPVDPDRDAVDTEFGTLSNHVDYPPALWVAAHSSNFTVANRPSSHAITHVVIHVMQGTYAGSISWFQNPSANVSAHYCVRSSDGQVTQMVRHKDIGWHARDYNSRSVGIEHEGWFDQAQWYTEAMYRSSAALTRHICDMHNIPKTRSRIVGHGEVNATPCPGQIWDWGRYMSYVTEDNGGDPIWTAVVDATSSDVTAGSSWQQSSWSSQKYGDYYLFNTPEPISDPVWYYATLPESGTYRIEVWHPADSGYNDSTPYVVAATGGNQSVRVNQRTGGGQWRSIGNFQMGSGRRQVVGVSRWTSGSGYVIADAVRISLLG
ncbi:N-acetylmuramoyl-L-alanine amidase [Phytoactinopolyspora limicola]|uniref:golvesin C-terminal-like domain-containing protein n=1 Tax=Phytoactinopolyspora limicola TaxID=2715536 RepID=UPI00140BE726|nr:N-acetylmuramoyl-L-alanine amidase [Phytoactinopolyspora limicola]